MIRSASLNWPITLGVGLLALIVALLVFWIIGQATANQWALLTVGTIFLALIMLGVVFYLILTIKQIRLTRRQANFIDSVTHELKSPIASIKLCLQTLNMREVSQAQQREFHQFMLKDLERLDSLIDHLLEAARLDHALRGEPLEEVPLRDVIRSCSEETRRRYDLRDDQIAFDLRPCLARARRQDLEMIFTNLLDNAAKYAGDPPRILVEVLPKGPHRVIVRISDNGKGVRHDLRRKIFDRFVRGGSELERTTHGTGLGLYLVKSLIGSMRGKINVHGRGPLGGATFEIELLGRTLDEPDPVASDPAKSLPAAIPSR